MAAERKWVLLGLPYGGQEASDGFSIVCVTERTVYERYIASEDMRVPVPPTWQVMAEADNEAELKALQKLMEVSDGIT